MKIKIGNYYNYLQCPDLSLRYLTFKLKCSPADTISIDDDTIKQFKNNLYNRFVFNALEYIEQFISNSIIYYWNKIFDRDQKTSIQIDKHDLNFIDRDLALITLAGLRKVSHEKHGSPIVDDNDVPGWLASDCEGSNRVNGTDALVHLRWEWTIKEIIWSFEKYTGDIQSLNKQEVYRMERGLSLFVKYYHSLWT